MGIYKYGFSYLTQHTFAPQRHHQEQGDDSAPRLRCTLCSALHATGGGGGGESSVRPSFDGLVVGLVVGL